MNWPFALQLNEVVAAIVAGSDGELMAKFTASRLSANDVRVAIGQCRGTLACPPEGVRLALDVVPIDGSDPPAYSVHVPLWTSEGIRSDLTLQVTVSEALGTHEIELNDIGVL